MTTPGPWSQPETPSPPPRRLARRRVANWAWLALIAGAALLVATLFRLFPDRVTTPEQWGGVASGLALVAVIGARLLSGYVGPGKTAKQLAIWAGIVAVIILGFSFRDEISQAALRVRSELSPETPLQSAPGEMVVARSDDGSFYVTGQVNGRDVRFLVDTGASDIVLSPRDAQRLGIDMGGLVYGAAVQTANGVGYGAPYKLSSLTVGDAVLNQVPVSVNKAPMSSSLLGMAFFNRMKSFRVEGSRLYIQPKPQV